MLAAAFWLVDADALVVELEPPELEPPEPEPPGLEAEVAEALELVPAAADVVTLAPVV